MYPPQHQPGPHPQYITSSMTPSQALASRLAQTSYQPPRPASSLQTSYQPPRPGNNFGYNFSGPGGYGGQGGGQGGYGGPQPPPPSGQAGQFYPQFYPSPVSTYQQQVASSQHQTAYTTVKLSSCQAVSSPHQTAFTAQARHSPGPSQTNPYQNSLAAQDREKVARSVSSDRDRGHRTERLKDSVEAEAGAASSNGELKRVKSVGDIITELQREAEALHNHKKKSPTSRPASRGATGLENWTPWPQLDQDISASSPNGHQSPGVASPAADDSCLASLRAEDARLCRQLHEMGFPLPRLAKGISAVGPDSQKLINFCLVVDR